MYHPHRLKTILMFYLFRLLLLSQPVKSGIRTVFERCLVEISPLTSTNRRSFEVFLTSEDKCSCLVTLSRGIFLPFSFPFTIYKHPIIPQFADDSAIKQATNNAVISVFHFIPIEVVMNCSLSLPILSRRLANPTRQDFT